MHGIARSMLKNENATLNDLVLHIRQKGYKHIHFGGLFSCKSILSDLEEFLQLLNSTSIKCDYKISTSIDTNFDAENHWGFIETIDISKVDNLEPKKPYINDVDSKLWKVFKYIDFGLFNDLECRMMAGGYSDLESSLQILSKYFRKAIMATRGEKGVLGMHNGSNSFFNFDSLNVSVVDATGAGDCFNAGFIFNYILNKNETQNEFELIEKSAQYGCYAGSLGVTRMGASDIPITFADIEDLVCANNSSKKIKM